MSNNFSCIRARGEGRRKKVQSVWNLLSRLPLGDPASLYLPAEKSRTSIIFPAAIVMRLAEIPRGRSTSTEKNFPGHEGDARRKRNYGSPSSACSEPSPDHFFLQPSSLSLSLSFVNTRPLVFLMVLRPWRIFSSFFFLIFEEFCSDSGLDLYILKIG